MQEPIIDLEQCLLQNVEGSEGRGDARKYSNVYAYVQGRKYIATVDNFQASSSSRYCTFKVEGGREEPACPRASRQGRGVEWLAFWKGLKTMGAFCPN